jgi:hypothetical protein
LNLSKRNRGIIIIDDPIKFPFSPEEEESAKKVFDKWIKKRFSKRKGTVILGPMKIHESKINKSKK